MTAKITEINKLSRLSTLGYFRPHGRLPFLGLVLGLRKLRNVIAGVPKGDEAAAPDLRRDAVEPNQRGFTRTIFLSTTLASLRGFFLAPPGRLLRAECLIQQGLKEVLGLAQRLPIRRTYAF